MALTIHIWEYASSDLSSLGSVSEETLGRKRYQTHQSFELIWKPISINSKTAVPYLEILVITAKLAFRLFKGDIASAHMPYIVNKHVLFSNLPFQT